MRKLILAVCLLAATTCVKAQQVIKGQGVGDFKEVTLVGNMGVELRQADAPGIEIELKDVDAKQVSWSVGNQGLNVRYRPMSIKTGGYVKVKIYYRSLESVSTNGAEVMIADEVRSGMFTADITSGAKFTGKFDCVDLQVHLTGNSAAQIEGKAKYLSLEANQRGKIDARGMQAISANVQAYIGAEIYVWSTERLVAQTNTGASIFYKGEPSILRVQTKMGGTINNIGEIKK